MATINKNLTVSIIGRPNAGKSTLLNALLGEKLSIVTPKVQTTRSVITGIVTIDQTQLILLDTPGIFSPKRKLEKAMVRCAWSTINSADVIVMIIDSSYSPDAMVKQIMQQLGGLNKPIIFLLNKIDLKSKHYLANLQFIEQTSKTIEHKIFNISALNGQGLTEFKQYLQNQAQNIGWLYQADDITNLPARFLANEITREQLFLNLDQELPYNLTVECEQWTEQADGSVKINQVIIVARNTHKNIVIGSGGQMIKKISTIARKNIQKLLGQPVHLFLFVKSRKNWEDYAAAEI